MGVRSPWLKLFVKTRRFNKINYLFVIVMFGSDNNFVGNQVGRVESHTKLANHRNISTSLEGLHEGLCAGLGDSSQVVDQVSLK